MRKLVRWIGLALLALTLVVGGGCNKCDLKLEDLVGAWNYIVAYGTCSGGAGCTGFPAGQIIEVGSMVIDANGALYADGEYTGIVIDADCDGEITGTWSGIALSVTGEGTDDHVTITATIAEAGITWTFVITLTR